MPTQPPTVGIIGYGRFGKLITEIAPPTAQLSIYEPNFDQDTDPRFKSLVEVLGSNIIILAIPLGAYETVLPEVAEHITPDQLLVDICSVKVNPAQLIRKFLPNHQSLLITHPLFGPQSYGKSPDNNRLIVTESSGALADTALQYCQDTLKLNITHMTAEEHDQIMARVHALTFFVARGLANLELGTEEFMTPSYEKILNLVKFNEFHSDELFQTIELGNPYAKEMRERIVNSFDELNAQLNDIEN